MKKNKKLIKTTVRKMWFYLFVAFLYYLWMISRVLHGSFWATSLKASLASKGLSFGCEFKIFVSWISNRIVPALTREIQWSTLPLPFPIRVSLGLAVTGTFGKTRVQILAVFFRCRIKTRRQASIWALFKRVLDKHWIPNEPKTNLDFKLNFFVCPFICLRYFTLFGCRYIWIFFKHNEFNSK